MSVNTITRIERTKETSGVVPQEQVLQDRKRLELNVSEAFEQGASSDLAGFVSPIDPQTQASIAQFYGRFADSDGAKLREASNQLGAALLGPGDTTTRASAIQSAGTSAMVTYLATTGSKELTQANQEFMYMALSGLESNLTVFANKAKANNEIASDLRTTIMELQDAIANWPADKDKQSFTWNEVTYDKDGKPTVTSHSAELTKKEAEELKDKIELQRDNCSTFSETAKFDLQRVYQDYTQAVQTLANIQKQMYDDAMKILNNLKA